MPKDERKGFFSIRCSVWGVSDCRKAFLLAAPRWRHCSRSTGLFFQVGIKEKEGCSDGWMIFSNLDFFILRIPLNLPAMSQTLEFAMSGMHRHCLDFCTLPSPAHSFLAGNIQIVLAISCPILPPFPRVFFGPFPQ